MDWSNYEDALLAIDVWREARGEVMDAKRAVAFSVLNRVKNPKWWGSTIAQVIGKKFQYSSMAAPGDPNLIKWPAQPDPSFEDCMQAAADAISDSGPNPVPGADSYYDKSISAPAWAKPEQFVAQVGNLFFYNTDGDHPSNGS